MNRSRQKDGSHHNCTIPFLNNGKWFVCHQFGIRPKLSMWSFVCSWQKSLACYQFRLFYLFESINFVYSNYLVFASTTRIFFIAIKTSSLDSLTSKCHSVTIKAFELFNFIPNFTFQYIFINDLITFLSIIK